MANVLALLILAGGLAATAGTLSWLGTRIRRRGIGGGLMGPIDEIYNPGAHRSRLEIQMQDQRIAPAPSPGDGWGRTRHGAGQPGRRDGPTAPATSLDADR